MRINFIVRDKVVYCPHFFAHIYNLAHCVFDFATTVLIGHLLTFFIYFFFTFLILF